MNNFRTLSAIELHMFLDNNYKTIARKCDIVRNAEGIEIGVKWQQESQYIDEKLESDIRKFLGNQLSEFYWIGGYQYVYVKTV